MAVYPRRDLIRLHPRPNSLYINRGRIAFITDRDGCIWEQAEQGLFVHETRMLSRYRYFVDGDPPRPIALSKIDQHSWLGHYICPAPGVDTGSSDHGSGLMEPASEYTLELRVSRSIGNNVQEEICLTNYTQETIGFSFELELDADFADIQETATKRRQQGVLDRSWREVDDTVWALDFDYRAEHHYDHQGNAGTAGIHRGLTVYIRGAKTSPAFEEGSIVFDVRLDPRAAWEVNVEMVPRMEDAGTANRQRRSDGEAADLYRRTNVFLRASTTFTAPDTHTFTPVVLGAIERARQDLASLRLFDLDHGAHAWTMAAGAPIYLALYGRDVLTAAWQAALLGSEMMQGSLQEVARWQGTEINDWRDEQPGRMPHELHTGPLKVLNVTPHGRNYSSTTTSAFFPVVLAELWHWTGDRELVRRFLGPAIKALQWLDMYEENSDGFYAYQTHSRQGVKHQAWKDSPDAIVYADGSSVEPPIATCESQGFVYLAKLHLSEVLWWLDEKDQAKKLYREARELKKRFNDMFWMEEEGFFAMGIDAKGQKIRSIGSNPGHCLATAIVDEERAAPTVERLFAGDMFTGWGIRTLSAQNPAFNPYSYHRGSVWPVEHGTFTLALMRYGLHEEMHHLCRAQFEAAALFDHYRLPEVFSGHQRTEKQPFPAFYPKANAPQAWSASAVLCMVQAMLGLYPYAPLDLLLVDPHLPVWLPEITLRKLRVGNARVTIRFYRKENGTSSYAVEGMEGNLHVVRQPSPWSLTASYGERLKDALMSLAPGK